MHHAGLVTCSRTGSADRPAQRNDRRAALPRPGPPDASHRGAVCARRTTGTHLRGRCRARGRAGARQRFLDRPPAGPRGNWRWFRRSQRLVVYPWPRRIPELSRARCAGIRRAGGVLALHRLRRAVPHPCHAGQASCAMEGACAAAAADAELFHDGVRRRRRRRAHAAGQIHHRAERGGGQRGAVQPGRCGAYGIAASSLADRPARRRQ